MDSLELKAAALNPGEPDTYAPNIDRAHTVAIAYNEELDELNRRNTHEYCHDNGAVPLYREQIDERLERTLKWAEILYDSPPSIAFQTAWKSHNLSPSSLAGTEIDLPRSRNWLEERHEALGSITMYELLVREALPEVLAFHLWPITKLEDDKARTELAKLVGNPETSVRDIVAFYVDQHKNHRMKDVEDRVRKSEKILEDISSGRASNTHYSLQ